MVLDHPATAVWTENVRGTPQVLRAGSKQPTRPTSLSDWLVAERHVEFRTGIAWPGVPGIQSTKMGQIHPVSELPTGIPPLFKSRKKLWERGNGPENHSTLQDAGQTRVCDGSEA